MQTKEKVSVIQDPTLVDGSISASMISRRKALKYLGFLGSTMAGREFLASWIPLSTVHADDPNGLHSIAGMHRMEEAAVPANYTPQFFRPDEFQTVEILTELIIPTDESPGAKEAQVANYIDFVVFSAAEFKPELQREWSSGLAILDRLSQARFGRSFRDASHPQQVELLTEMSGPESDPKLQHEGFEFYALVKDMTVEGFYTSKIGLIDVLDYKGMNYMADFPGCTHPEHQR